MTGRKTKEATKTEVTEEANGIGCGGEGTAGLQAVFGLCFMSDDNALIALGASQLALHFANELSDDRTLSNPLQSRMEYLRWSFYHLYVRFRFLNIC